MHYLHFFIILLVMCVQSIHVHAFSSPQPRKVSPATRDLSYQAQYPLSSKPPSRISKSSGSLSDSVGYDDHERRTEEIPMDKSALDANDAVSNKPSNISEATVPTYKRLLLFTMTTVLIWISEPLLSLVDTTVVGLTQKDAVVQVAALGPSTTLIDSLQYLTYFLAMCTTSQVAKFLALKDYRNLQKSTSQILGVAALMGATISAIVFAFGMPLLKAMIGSSQSPELVGLAARYCWIRATVAPLAVMGMVAESSCLANVDTTTPAVAVLSASIVNVVGDLGLSFLGIQGAAIATAIATTTSTFIMLRKVKQRKDIWREKELAAASTGLTEMANGTPFIKQMRNITADVDINSTGTVSLAQVAAKEVPFLSLPSRSAFLDLLKLSGPLFFVMLGKIACYGAMSVRATHFGVVNLAAHSIMMRVFFFFTCWGDSLSQATQSFLPRSLYPTPVKKDIRKIMKRLVIFASCVAIFVSLASRFILTNCGGYLTNDGAVIGAVAEYGKLAAMSLLLHPFILLSEGSMISTRDFRYLISSYSVTMIMHFSLLVLTCASFQDIWRVFFTFQAVRLALFGTRAFRNVFNRSEKNALQAEVAPAA